MGFSFKIKIVDKYIVLRYSDYIEVRYILLVDIIAPRYIVLKYIGGIVMDAHTRKVYVPMTETGFYILFCLQKPNHGYGKIPPCR